MTIAELEQITEFDYTQLAEQVMTWCDELANITATPGKISRFYMTPEHLVCNQVVQGWMQEAGMEAWVDQAGNVCGRYHAKGFDKHAHSDPYKAFLLGSHLDSIPNAGRYDGILGVLLSIAAIKYLHQQEHRFDFHVDVLGFGDEEGTRFGTTLLGSRAVADTWQESWWEQLDKDKTSMHQAFMNSGFNPDEIRQASRAGDNLLGYLEVHIEQGPVLEQHDCALGIVTAIAGARRFQLEIEGYAGHSGTVPMSMRQDAVVGAAQSILAIEAIAKDFGVLATVGQISSRPGAVNVIAGRAILSLDIRSDNDELRDQALEEIQFQVSQLCQQRGLTYHWDEIHNASAVMCAPWLQDLQGQILESMDLPPLKLISGAGHDAMGIAHITDIAMYFVRCKGGVSHHPDELVYVEDVELALEGLVKTLVALDKL
jgi:allantoate deiminase